MIRRRSSCLVAGTVTWWLAACTANTPHWYPDDPVSAPTLFAPGIVSTEGSREYDITFTPDARTIYFTRRPTGGQQRIYVAHFRAGGWTVPVPAAFSPEVAENPFVTADGEHLLFARRNLGDNIWIADRSGATWTNLRPLRGNVNRSRPTRSRWPQGSQLFPSIGPDSLLYYWTEMRGSGTRSDLYTARRHGDRWRSLGPIDHVNSDARDSAPTVAPGGEYLIFQSDRRDLSEGGSDLYLSRRTDRGWSEPTNLGAIVNGSANEGYPRFTPDGRFLFFASDRGPAGEWSIYFIDVGVIRSIVPSM